MSDRQIRNAIITDADLDTERGLTYWITLDYGGAGQAFGGYQLGGPSRFTELAITRLMDVVGVGRWSELKGKAVRADATGGKVFRLGNHLRDKWIDLEEIARELGLR
jgi:hypothetical protein